MEETVAPETTVQETPVAPTQTVEQQLASLNKISKKRHEMFSTLVRAHVADYLQTLAFQPGLSGNKKFEMINNFVTMLEGVLDFGLDITKVTVPEKGSIGKKTATIGGILAQAMDNKFVLLAQNLKEDEQSTENKGE